MVYVVIVIFIVFVYFVEAAVFTYRHFTRLNYPNFFFKGVSRSKLGIPVFYYHSINDPAFFKGLLEYLLENGYVTITADELYESIVNRVSKPNAVVLTFDDGRGSLWSIVYPLLKKYGFRAVAFVIPGRIGYRRKYYPNLEDVWAGRAPLEEVTNREYSDQPMVTWEEVEEMHNGGVIDFQSHTLYHTRILTSPRIIDFINPTSPVGFDNDNMPLIRENGVDLVHSGKILGTPIYTFAPRMSASRRYFDDENLRQACIRYVADHGGEAFFRGDWKSALDEVVTRYCKGSHLSGRYETDQERAAAIFESLYTSKKLIKEHLPNKVVRHLAYPWSQGSDLVQELSKEAGYVTNFWGMLPKESHDESVRDPFRIVRWGRLLRWGGGIRWALPGGPPDLIYSLPGEGRRSYLFPTVLSVFLKHLKYPVQMTKTIISYCVNKERSDSRPRPRSARS